MSAGYDQMKARTMAIARGERTPAKGEPKVWFTSIESFARLLSEHNRHLLEPDCRERPRSLTELAVLAGRSKSNLSRTLKTMSQYGLVELRAGARRTLVLRVPLRPGEARCLADRDEEWIGRGQPVKLERIVLRSPWCRLKQRRGSQPGNRVAARRYPTTHLQGSSALGDLARVSHIARPRAGCDAGLVQQAHDGQDIALLEQRTQFQLT